MSEEDIIKSIDEYFSLDKVEEGEAFKRGYFSAMYRIKNIWKQLEESYKNALNTLSKKEKVLDKIKEYCNNYIEVEDAPINERIKCEFKVILELLEEIE